MPVIVIITRITDQYATIIDHICYFEGNNCKRELNMSSGNLWCDITDHLTNFFVIKNKKLNATKRDL